MHDTQAAVTALSHPCRQWLQDHAPSLDRSTRHAGELLPLFARTGLLRERAGLDERVEGVAEVSAQSLAAGLVLSAQLGFIELLQCSHNVALREHLLPSVLEGSLAGAPALSPAYSHLAQGTALPVRGVETPTGWRLNGRLGCVVNLQREGHAVALPVAFDGLQAFSIVMLGSEENGVGRGPDLASAGLRGIRAAALQLDEVHFREDELLHVNGAQLLRRLLPGILALHCAMALGVAHGALSAIEAIAPALRQGGDAQRIAALLQENRAALADGLRSERLRDDPLALSRLRTCLAELARAATQAEQRALGLETFLFGSDIACARRAREAAFLALLRPTADQMEPALSTSAVLS